MSDNLEILKNCKHGPNIMGVVCDNCKELNMNKKVAEIIEKQLNCTVIETWSDKEISERLVEVLVSEGVSFVNLLHDKKIPRDENGFDSRTVEESLKDRSEKLKELSRPLLDFMCSSFAPAEYLELKAPSEIEIKEK